MFIFDCKRINSFALCCVCVAVRYVDIELFDDYTATDIYQPICSRPNDLPTIS